MLAASVRDSLFRLRLGVRLRARMRFLLRALLLLLELFLGFRGADTCGESTVRSVNMLFGFLGVLNISCRHPLKRFLCVSTFGRVRRGRLG